MSRQVAEQGTFKLQQCEDCGEIIYPPREMCGACLSENVRWQQHASGSSCAGEVLAVSKLGHSFDPAFDDAYSGDDYPEILSVKLDDGPTVIAFAGDAGLAAGARVTLHVEDHPPAGPAIVAHKIEEGGA